MRIEALDYIPDLLEQLVKKSNLSPGPGRAASSVFVFGWEARGNALNRAEPDLVVAFALPFETAALREQEFLDLRGEGRAHQEARRTRSWRWLVSSKAMASG